MNHAAALEERVRARMGEFGSFEERNVMSGVGFFTGDRMALAVLDDCLCLRLDEAVFQDRVLDDGVSRYAFAGRPVPGWISVQEAVLDDEGLAWWIGQALSSNSQDSAL